MYFFLFTKSKKWKWTAGIVFKMFKYFGIWEGAVGGRRRRRRRELRIRLSQILSLKPQGVLKMQIQGPQPHPQESELLGSGLGNLQICILTSCPGEEDTTERWRSTGLFSMQNRNTVSSASPSANLPGPGKDFLELLSDFLGEVVPLIFKAF